MPDALGHKLIEQCKETKVFHPLTKLFAVYVSCGLERAVVHHLDRIAF